MARWMTGGVNGLRPSSIGCSYPCSLIVGGTPAVRCRSEAPRWAIWTSSPSRSIRSPLSSSLPSRAWLAGTLAPTGVSDPLGWAGGVGEGYAEAGGAAAGAAGAAEGTGGAGGTGAPGWRAGGRTPGA